jgi:putative transposase
MRFGWVHSAGMNPPRVTAEEYTQFLLATPKASTCTEAARVPPAGPDPPAHDAFTRLLHRLEPDPAELWAEVAPLVDRAVGVLVVDDTTLDKPYARKIELVTRHWSGKHRAVVDGINLITVVWADADRMYPTDYRVYHKVADRKTKNDHFRDLLSAAYDRGFYPRYVLFDGWYTGLENLKLVRSFGWLFLGRLKSDRLVRLDGGPPTRLDALRIAESGTVVWLPGYGLVKILRSAAPDGGAEYWVTNDPDLDASGREELSRQAWAVETYHRGLKQYTGVERCQCRAARAQRNHIGLAIRGFVRLEYHRVVSGVSWFRAKWDIIRGAVRDYLTAPTYRLPNTATA